MEGQCCWADLAQHLHEIALQMSAGVAVISSLAEDLLQSRGLSSSLHGPLHTLALDVTTSQHQRKQQEKK